MSFDRETCDMQFVLYSCLSRGFIMKSLVSHYLPMSSCKTNCFFSKRAKCEKETKCVVVSFPTMIMIS